MDVQTQLPLAPRDLLILSVLAEGPLHGYGIIKAVESRSESGVLLDPANLYRVLRRMRGSGWVREAQRPDGKAAPAGSVGHSQDGGGSPHRRRTYEITSFGGALLKEELARLERLLKHARPAMAQGGGGDR